MAWSIESTLVADVSADDVFRHYATPETWGRWLRDTVRATRSGTVRPGTRVELRAAATPLGPVATLRLHVLEIVPGSRVTTLLRLPGIEIVGTFEVADDPHGARIRHALRFSGSLDWAYRLLRGAYVHGLDREVRRLADLVRDESLALAPGVVAA